MCGISGIINYDVGQPVTQQELERITDVIAHRGPDGYGYWLHNNIGFGHRRLSIIDLAGSKQPMKIDEDKFVITFNGEIYNYLELKQRLQNLGHTFRTTGDTEVILKSYQEWGTACLNKFRGMFAFAIADLVQQEIFIARDHFGIKPLVYYQGDDYFMFGSEIQQFPQDLRFKKAIDTFSLSEYLRYGYIPAPRTIYKNMFKLEPGHYIRVTTTGKIIEQQQYYDVAFRPNYKVTYNEWSERVEAAIDSSVAYHKIADVPYGTFLSGGIDSSLIASSLAQKGKNVDAFTMGFENEEFNEVPYAKEVAEKYHLKHHIEYVDMSDMESVFPKLIQHYGEPYADSSAIPTYYITKKIREYLPVVLSGDGGDEAFGGYYSYQNFLKIAKPNPPKHEYKNHIKTILKYFGKTFKTTPRTPNLEDWIDLVGVFGIANSDKLMQDRSYEADTVYKKWYDKAKAQKLDLYSAASYLDYKTYIHGDVLTKVDIAAMMNSLEVRTPLIDVDVVNLMAQIPAKHKISRNRDGSWQKKKLLNTIAAKRFGKEFVNRKKKGFTVPLIDWFGKGTTFGDEFEHIIHNNNSHIFNYVDQQVVQELFSNPKTTDVNQLYALFSLEYWLKMNSDNAI